jgi:DNA-binding Xre family transcriptional regulator
MKGGLKMAVSYNRLWKLLIDRSIKKSQLREMAQIGTTTLAKLGKNEKVSLDVIESICFSLDCKIEEIIEIIPNDIKAGE